MTAAAKAAFLRFLLCYCLTLHMCDVTIILIQCFFCYLPFLIFKLSLRGIKRNRFVTIKPHLSSHVSLLCLEIYFYSKKNVCWKILSDIILICIISTLPPPMSSRWTWWPMRGPMVGRTARLLARGCLEQGWDHSSRIRRACQIVCLISLT